MYKEEAFQEYENLFVKGKGWTRAQFHAFYFDITVLQGKIFKRKFCVYTFKMFSHLKCFFNIINIYFKSLTF